MRLEHHKNFLTLEECFVLNAWVDEGVEKKWLDVGISKGQSDYTKRFTSRFYGNRFEYPQIVLDVSNRIRKFCGVDSYGLIGDHGRDGVVVSCIFPGGDVYAHTDPQKNMYSALRCNVMTRKADVGGQLYVNGQCINIEVGDLHCYLASNYEHYITTVEGETNRVLWMFGAYVPQEDWDNGVIKVGAH